MSVKKESTSRQKRRSGLINNDISSEIRSEAKRDLDRLYYTYYFRRLAEITQVMTFGVPISSRSISGASGLPHNRLTHSLKVGQVGRRMTQYLMSEERNAIGIEVAGGIDPDVVEAAGRAHDLGHPPFGHVGEHALDRLAQEYGLTDGFEGNAQTFRILATLVRRYSDKSKNEYYGLDLTAATLAACVKYPWKRQEKGRSHAKFGFIDLDQNAFIEMVAPLLPENPERGTLEAQIMDWADDISYAAHDIEDFTLDGRIPLHLLAHRQNPGEDNKYTPVNIEEYSRFLEYASTRLTQIGKPVDDSARQAFQELAGSFPRWNDDSRAREGLLQKVSSQIITITSKATSVTADGILDVEESVAGLVRILKQLTWFYVIDRPEIVSLQRGQVKRLRAVTEELIQWVSYATRTKDDPFGDGETTDLLTTQVSLNMSTLPPLLCELVQSLKDANNRRGAYEGSPEKNIARAVIDFVASLRESEVEQYYELMCR